MGAARGPYRPQNLSCSLAPPPPLNFEWNQEKIDIFLYKVVKPIVFPAWLKWSTSRGRYLTAGARGVGGKASAWRNTVTNSRGQGEHSAPPPDVAQRENQATNREKRRVVKRRKRRGKEKKGRREMKERRKRKGKKRKEKRERKGRKRDRKEERGKVFRKYQVNKTKITTMRFTNGSNLMSFWGGYKHGGGDNPITPILPHSPGKNWAGPPPPLPTSLCYAPE